MIYNTVEADDTPILEFSKQEFEKEDIVSSLNKMLLFAWIKKEFNV